MEKQTSINDKYIQDFLDKFQKLADAANAAKEKLQEELNIDPDFVDPRLLSMIGADIVASTEILTKNCEYILRNLKKQKQEVKAAVEKQLKNHPGYKPPEKNPGEKQADTGYETKDQTHPEVEKGELERHQCFSKSSEELPMHQ